MKKHYELGAEVGQVFNLASEIAVDPWRIERERQEQDKHDFEAWQYQKKMQRTFTEVPGYVGGDVPVNDGAIGKIIIEPGRITEAMQWLKRRFVVNENLELSTDLGLCVEVCSKAKRVAGKPNQRRVCFDRPIQFDLGL
jgi:hypothetical protein